MLIGVINKNKNKIIFLGFALLALDILVYSQILFAKNSDDLVINFLDVGQGDSQLVTLPGEIDILIDGGSPNRKVLDGLTGALSPLDRYIDLVILSHAQFDHFGGLIDVLKRYKIGAFIYNGRRGEIRAFDDLQKALEKNEIPVVVLGAGDRIHHKESVINVLSPDTRFLKSKDINDSSLVLELVSNGSKSLFTGDISSKLEESLINFYKTDIDILKVAHHGSKFSSSANFLNAVKPEVAVIGVGKNSYGHPTSQVLSRLSDIGSKIYRTDLDNNVKLVVDGEKIRVFK